MVDDHNPESIESKPLNTEIETLAPELGEEHSSPSNESTSNHTETPMTSESTTQAEHQPAQAEAEAPASPQTPSENPASGQIAPSLSASTEEPEQDYDDSDFAAALASFDREQAVESATAQSLTADEVIVTGTVVKITEKHVVVDIGLKSEGLLPLDQVLDANGVSKFQPGDSVEVVVEREEQNGGGYVVSHEKALRHKIWDKLEEASNTKVPVKGMVVSRVKGGLTVDIGIKAFLPRIADRDPPRAQSRRLRRHRDRSPHHQAQQEARQRRHLPQRAARRRAERAEDGHPCHARRGLSPHRHGQEPHRLRRLRRPRRS